MGKSRISKYERCVISKLRDGYVPAFYEEVDGEWVLVCQCAEYFDKDGVCGLRRAVSAVRVEHGYEGLVEVFDNFPRGGGVMYELPRLKLVASVDAHPMSEHLEHERVVDICDLNWGGYDEDRRGRVMDEYWADWALSFVDGGSELL